MNLARRRKARLRLLRRRLHAINIEILRLSIRLIPSESQRVFGLTLIIGVVCGLAAVAFHLTIRFAEDHLIEAAMNSPGYRWIWLTILVPVVGGLICGWFLEKVVPDARGSGIPQVKTAYVIRGGKMRFRVAIGKFLISALQIGSGASLGREGPTVQICAGIAAFFGRIAALSRQNLARLLPVGAAAGIAAAFNAPIAAVTFTIEEIVGDLDQTILSGVVVAAALAAVVERGILGEHPIFNIPGNYGLHHPSSLLFYGMLGIAASLVSVAFTDSLLYLRRKFQTLQSVPVWARPSIGGAVTGLLTVGAITWFNTRGITGGGYDTLSEALSGKLAVQVMIALCALKLVATVFSYASGGAGGIFAPALFIGAMLGGVFGILDVRILGHGSNEFGAFALVGMGAVFAGIIRAPITSVIIIFEMTGAYSLILPLMVANTISYILAQRQRPKPIYEALLEQDGVTMPHREKSNQKVLESIRVGQAMNINPISLNKDLTVGEAAKFAQGKDFSVFPVVDAKSRYVGIIGEARLRRMMAEKNKSGPIAQFMESRPYILPESSLLEAVVKMHHLEVRQIAVVSSKKDRHLVGWLSMTDIVLKQAEENLDDDIEITVLPEMGPETELADVMAKRQADSETAKAKEAAEN
ncbi:MAG: chloride channel protein [Pyrinomonadaceae bacterium]